VPHRAAERKARLIRGALDVSTGMYFVAFRVLTPKVVRARRLLPGAVAGGAAWTALQVLGTYLVRHFLYTDSVYGVFATVLGLLPWIYFGETNVVLAWQLRQRSIVRPPLTAADRAVLAGRALQNQRRDDQHITVSFDYPPPGTAAYSTPPQASAEKVSPAHSRSGGGTETAP